MKHQANIVSAHYARLYAIFLSENLWATNFHIETAGLSPYSFSIILLSVAHLQVASMRTYSRHKVRSKQPATFWKCLCLQSMFNRIHPNQFYYFSIILHIFTQSMTLRNISRFNSFNFFFRKDNINYILILPPHGNDD